MILHKWYLPMPKENLSIYSVCIGRNIIGVFRCLKKKKKDNTVSEVYLTP